MPRIKAIPNTAPINPKALPLFSGGYISPITADATGNIPDAPNPCIALPVRRISKLCEAATINEPNENTDNAVIYIFLLPNRSESLAINEIPVKLASI